MLDLANKEANLELVSLSVPDLLKAPVGVKKLFTENSVDSIIAFFEADSEEDKDSIALIHEKILDLEIYNSKYVFYCIAFNSEWHDNQSLETLGEQRLSALFERVMSFNLGVSPPQANTPFDFFTPSNELPTAPLGNEQQDTMEEEVHKLF